MVLSTACKGRTHSVLTKGIGTCFLLASSGVIFARLLPLALLAALDASECELLGTFFTVTFPAGGGGGGTLEGTLPGGSGGSPAGDRVSR